MAPTPRTGKRTLISTARLATAISTGMPSLTLHLPGRYYRCHPACVRQCLRGRRRPPFSEHGQRKCLTNGDGHSGETIVHTPSQVCNPSGDPLFPGSDLPDCSFLASQIQTCQSKGKIVTLSLGGATGLATFSSASEASKFGDTIWNLFLGGSSSTRPFGSAVLDGYVAAWLSCCGGRMG